MTFWLDANLDPDLAAWLGASFRVLAKHLTEIGLERATDREIFDAARRMGAIVIVTKDSISLTWSRSSVPHHRC